MIHLLTRTILLLTCSTLAVGIVTAQNDNTLLIPIGGGYADTYEGFLAAVLNRDTDDALNIVVLPTAYSTDAGSITDEEHAINLEDAENRREQIEEYCLDLMPEGATCNVVIVPIFTRSHADDPTQEAFFGDDLDAVYILGGDQTVAMQAIMGTAIEAALQTAYERGVIIAGTSAGLSMQSQTMIGGYQGALGPERGLNESAVEVWQDGDRRGLNFGINNAILEQHFWERGRFARLLNALATAPDAPRVGVGVDAYTAAEIVDGTTLQNVFGLYSVGILDAETLDSARDATFIEDILSIRNVLVHILAPGEFSFNLETRETTLAPTLDDVERDFESLTAPEGAGTLILTGSLHAPFENNPMLGQLVELAGGTEARILAVYDGFPDVGMFDGTAPYFEAGLQSFGVNAIDSWDVGREDEPPETLDSYSGILFVGNDATAMHPEKLSALKDAWLSGTPILADWTASSVLGGFYAADGQTPQATDEEPFADSDFIQGAFIDGNTTILPGLGLLNITVETRVMADYRLGRLVALAYHHPDLLAVGLNEETALEITPEAATVIGSNGMIVLDLRNAALDKGTNDAYVFANGLLDVFAPGETLQGGA